MLTLILRRVLVLIPTTLLLSFGVFVLSAGLRPERAAEVRAGGIEASQEAIERAIRELHLDDPFMVRYVHWLGDAVRLDFGRSYTRLEAVQTADGSEQRGRLVTDAIAAVAPRTLSLVAVAIVFSLVIGLGVGVVGGTRPGSFPDRFAFVVSTIGLAIPSFWLAMLLITWLAVSWGWLPAVGYLSIGEGGIWGWLERLILPGVALSLAPAAIIARQTRSALVDVMGSTYIRTAWAKGASRSRVVFRHALKNSLSAPLTVFGLLLTSLLSGTVVIETLFGIQGVGTLVVSAVHSSDIPMLQGVVMLFIFVTVMINLLVDIMYGILDPRVRIT